MRYWIVFLILGVLLLGNIIQGWMIYSKTAQILELARDQATAVAGQILEATVELERVSSPGESDSDEWISRLQRSSKQLSMLRKCYTDLV
ncbi:hypothetical protein SY88_17250 [Clostridiales bacterium PH28_bin88]|nr:hypothetical protein SY88_17250 [Clostridiales bacterium PH28_bin88]